MYKINKFKPIYYLIILLTLISYKIIDDNWLTRHAELRYKHQMSILKGEVDYPYQYRVLKPAMGIALQKIIYLAVNNSYRANLYAYRINTLLAFLLIYYFFYYFLKMFFSDATCMIGLLLLQAVIPLTINGQYGEGDFYNFLFYTIGLILIFKSKDYYLPIVFTIGILNREQIIFLMIFYIAYLITQKRLFSKKSYIVITISLIACAIVCLALRWKFGWKYTVINKNAVSNITQVWYIISLWAAEVFIFIILSLKSFKKSSQFFKLGFISIGLYIVIYFFYGYLGELAKFLPAYLIIIPMSLETLTGESTDNKKEALPRTINSLNPI
ncbi:MAG: hypothetical protein M3R36_02515 [Bacteroidota bacterium]|nr:hypothetical protein [Bacteroidota bacterium]